MKNIYILSTEIPSRLTRIYNDVKKENFTLKLDVKVNDSFKEYINIYITSDEEIKEGDWYIDDSNMIRKAFISDKEYWSTRWAINSYCKKVILTTDQDLTKDGIQKIDNEFLEWFVKNPHYEQIDVGYGFIRLSETDNKGYWASIPGAEFNMQKEESKQETLEESAKKYYKDNIDQSNIPRDHYEVEIQDLMIGFASKWQQERMYSEDEVEEIVSKLMHEVHCGDITYTDYVIDFKTSPRKWFQQFKKK